MDQPRVAQSQPEFVAQFAVLFAVRAAVIVELDIKTGEVGDVLFTDGGDQRFFRATFLTGANHNRGAMRIVGTEVATFVAAQFLETDPDIGLDVFHEVADVNFTVGVRQSSGD